MLQHLWDLETSHWVFHKDFAEEGSDLWGQRDVGRIAVLHIHNFLHHLPGQRSGHSRILQKQAWQNEAGHIIRVGDLQAVLLQSLSWSVSCDWIFEAWKASPSL